MRATATSHSLPTRLPPHPHSHSHPRTRPLLLDTHRQAILPLTLPSMSASSSPARVRIPSNWTAPTPSTALTAVQVVGTLRKIKKIEKAPNTTLLIFRNHQKPRTLCVQKLDSTTNQPLAGWTFNLYQGSNCGGSVIQTGVTGSDGLVCFTGLAP